MAAPLPAIVTVFCAESCEDFTRIFTPAHADGLRLPSASARSPYETHLLGQELLLPKVTADTSTRAET